MKRRYKLVVVHTDLDGSLQSDELADSVSAYDAAKLMTDCNLPNIRSFTLAVLE